MTLPGPARKIKVEPIQVPAEPKKLPAPQPKERPKPKPEKVPT